MKPLTMALALTLAIVATPALATNAQPGTLMESHAPHPFDISDLVMMDRVSDPQLSADGRVAAFNVRRTDYAANKGINAISVQDLVDTGSKPIRVIAKGSSPRWSPNGHSLYYITQVDGVAQLWRLDFPSSKHGVDLAAAVTPIQVSHGPLDVGRP